MSNTKKSILNENTVRRFMKLAEIDKLSDGFVTGLVKEQLPGEDFEGDPEGLDDGPSGLEAAVDDVDALDMDPEEAPEGAALADAVSNLMGVISDMTGVEIDVDGGDVDDEVLDVPLGDEEVGVMAEQFPGPGGPHQPSRTARARRAGTLPYTRPRPSAGEEKPPEKHPKSPKQESLQRKAYERAAYQEQLHRAANYRHALKNEVFRRVSTRLQQESRRDAVADQLSERILRRIKNRK